MSKSREMKWINVKDELPELGKGILLYFTSGAMFCGYRSIENQDVNEWVIYYDDFEDGNMDSELTHWMPLPEPPKN